METKLGITIPKSAKFADLKLSRDISKGVTSFDWQPIEAICEASGLDVALFRDTEEGNVIELILTWYGYHLASGGSADPVAEQIIAEVQAESAFGAAAVQQSGGAVH